MHPISKRVVVWGGGENKEGFRTCFAEGFNIGYERKRGVKD